MTGRVSGKVALVTGAGSVGGIGQAIARRLAEEGAKVYLSDLQGASDRATEIERGAIGMVQDVTSESGWDMVLSQIERDEGRLDILVNNAGIVLLHPIEDMTLERFERQMKINMTGAFLGMRASVAFMRRVANGGSIVNISSVGGIVGMPRTHAYGATKAGLRVFGKGLALETAKDGIRVNSIHPGSMRTQMTAPFAAADPVEQQRRIASLVPLGRMGEPEDIAHCALFLASDEASYITGAEFVVDGGLTSQ